MSVRMNVGKRMNQMEEIERICASIYIVQVSCQLFDVLLQLIRRLQAILEETVKQICNYKYDTVKSFIASCVKATGRETAAVYV